MHTAEDSSSAAAAASSVCPWWLIRGFDNPLRRLVQKPEKILEGLVGCGDHCMDLGCGIGYFTIPMARMVGPSGSVTAVDLQPEMLEGVKRRAGRNDLLSRIRLHVSTPFSLQMNEAFDFILAFWMLHEVPDQFGMLREIHALLATGGRFLLVEPRVHVSAAAFRRSVSIAEAVGFAKKSEPRIFFSRAVLLAGKLLPAG